MIMKNNLIGISGKLGSGKDTVARMIQELQILSLGYGSEETLKRKTDSEINALSQWEIKRFADTLKDITCMLIGCTREQLEDREFKEATLGEEWNRYIVIPANDSEPLVFTNKEEAESASETYGLKLSRTGETLRQSEVVEKGMTPRKLMQLLGTEAGREVLHPNIWVNALFADYIKPKYENTGNSVSEEDVSIRPGEYPKWIIPDTRFPNETKAIKDRNGILIRINRLTANQIDNASTHFRDDVETIKDHPSETALDNWEDWDYIIENDGDLNDLLIKVKEVYNEVGLNTR